MIYVQTGVYNKSQYHLSILHVQLLMICIIVIYKEIAKQL